MFVALVWLFLEWRHFSVGAATLRLAVVGGRRLARLALPRRRPLPPCGAAARASRSTASPTRSIFSSSAPRRGSASTRRSSRSARTCAPQTLTVAEEFAATAAEMRVLPDRAQALENLALRTGISSLRSIIATLNQSIRFGTPLAESLRVLAAEMRTERLARFEERAARLPVLLSRPVDGVHLAVSDDCDRHAFGAAHHGHAGNRAGQGSVTARPILATEPPPINRGGRSNDLGRVSAVSTCPQPHPG